MHAQARNFRGASQPVSDAAAADTAATLQTVAQETYFQCQQDILSITAPSVKFPDTIMSIPMLELLKRIIRGDLCNSAYVWAFSRPSGMLPYYIHNAVLILMFLFGKLNCFFSESPYFRAIFIIGIITKILTVKLLVATARSVVETARRTCAATMAGE